MTIPMGPSKTCLRGDAVATTRILHHAPGPALAVDFRRMFHCILDGVELPFAPFGSRSGGDQYGVLFGMWSTNGRRHSGVLELRESRGAVCGRRSGGGTSAGSDWRSADQRRRSAGIFVLDPGDHFPRCGTVQQGPNVAFPFLSVFVPGGRDDGFVYRPYGHRDRTAASSVHRFGAHDPGDRGCREGVSGAEGHDPGDRPLGAKTGTPDLTVSHR